MKAVYRISLALFYGPGGLVVPASAGPECRSFLSHPTVPTSYEFMLLLRNGSLHSSRRFRHRIKALLLTDRSIAGEAPF